MTRRSKRSVCELCDRKQPDDDALRRHYHKVHDYCDDCEREFASYEGLKQHLRNAKTHRDEFYTSSDDESESEDDDSEDDSENDSEDERTSSRHRRNSKSHRHRQQSSDDESSDDDSGEAYGPRRHGKHNGSKHGRRHRDSDNSDSDSSSSSDNDSSSRGGKRKKDSEDNIDLRRMAEMMAKLMAEKEKSKDTERPQTYKCSICMEEPRLDSGLAIRNEACNHIFCRECIRDYVVDQIQNRKFPLTCPDCTVAKKTPEDAREFPL